MFLESKLPKVLLIAPSSGDLSVACTEDNICAKLHAERIKIKKVMWKILFFTNIFK